MTIKQLEQATEMAYSYDRYLRAGWRVCISFLLNKGLNDKQVQAWMLSKHTRWAGDFDDKSDYGYFNGLTVKNYIIHNPSSISKDELDMLVDGTF